MTVSALFKKFRCCKPAPILPTTQIQTTSYTYQLAFVQWALEYLLQTTEGYEERTAELETRATSCERAITQLQEEIDPILVDIEDLDDRVTALEQGGGGGGGASSPEILSLLGSVADIGSVSTANIPLYESIKTTNKITAADGKIVIGSGVSKIKVSGGIQIGLYNGGNDQVYVSLTRNGTSLAAGGSYLPTTASGVGYVPLLDRCLLVGSGDQLSFGASGLSAFSAGSISAYIHVEVLE